jgi:putative acetyltransferase
MNLIFQKAAVADAEKLSQLICENARITLAPFYTQEQWQSFQLEYSPESMRDKTISQDVYFAMLDGVLAGTVALKEDWVVGVYTAISHRGRGVGQKLMQFIETLAIQKGFSLLLLAASPVGASFYKKLGWETIAQQNFVYNGVMFEETLMRKRVVR